MRKVSIVLFGLGVLGAAFVAERDARACGGCFHPPTEDNSVITDHRMVLAISSQQTTLYDQIRYRGQPADFAWVLPVSGEVTVGLSADALFGALDLMSTTTVEAPDPNCPPQPSSCNTSLSASGAASDGGVAGEVTVTKQEVVGPYESVQLSATTPDALYTWLQGHNFAVPADVQPILAAYVQAHYGFVALRLKPGANVQSMRPVRVSAKGASPVLPLRMVAAGTGAAVGITLWVVAEGRYEAQNFPNFQITADEIAWDWSKNASNYKDLRAQRSADGKSWETESSQTFARAAIEQTVKYGYYFNGTNGGFGGGAPAPASKDYEPVTDASGTVLKTADQVRDEDLQTLFAGVPDTMRLTRLRADLAHAALAEDLDLRAAADPSVLSAYRKAKLEIGQPQCTVYNGCTPSGTLPRDEAQARAGQNAESFSCAAASAKPADDAPLGLAAAAGFLGFAVVRSRRRRA